MKKNPAKGIVKRKKKPKYKVRNWHTYNEALVRRGTLDFWVEKGWIKSWKVEILPPDKKKKGAQRIYSDHAIETVLSLGKVFRQPLRQTEGFVRSVFRLSGLNLGVPDHTTLSRRAGKIVVRLPVKDKKYVAAILDSTGLKVYGEGEWKVKKHGASKHRDWLKLHISIDRDGEIRAGLVTDNSIDDAKAGIELLENQSKFDRIDEIDADGAYDKRKMYKAALEHKIEKINIPPQVNAHIWFHGNLNTSPHPRDENLRAIRKTTRKKWKEFSGYHIRSKVESTMFRRKIIFGDKVSGRKIENQITEVMITLKALNKMMDAGMPETYKVT